MQASLRRIIALKTPLTLAIVVFVGCGPTRLYTTPGGIQRAAQVEQYNAEVARLNMRIADQKRLEVTGLPAGRNPVTDSLLDQKAALIAAARKSTSPSPGDVKLANLCNHLNIRKSQLTNTGYGLLILGGLLTASTGGVSYASTIYALNNTTTPAPSSVTDQKRTYTNTTLGLGITSGVVSLVGVALTALGTRDSNQLESLQCTQTEYAQIPCTKKNVIDLDDCPSSQSMCDGKFCRAQCDLDTPSAFPPCQKTTTCRPLNEADGSSLACW